MNAKIVALRLVGVTLLAAGVFLGAQSYRPAESGMTSKVQAMLSRSGSSEGPWSKGASVDPKLAAASAGCLAAGGLLAFKRN